jgi:radical SAM superfamily enzyme YgiQ (UPF0313 family)
MRVLLVYPYFIDNRINEEDVSTVPMGLYYVAAMLLANGYAVEILNAYDLGGAPQRIQRILEHKQPDLVGFSILHANRWGGIDIARMVKRINPNSVTVFGGVGATFLWEHLLTHFSEIDYVIRGEGEHSLLELVRFLEKAPSRMPDHIESLAFRKNGRPFATRKRRPVADLDSLPMPADYFPFQHIALSRGCPSGCTFCGSPAFWKRRTRFHSAAYFVSQIGRLYEKGIRFLFVSDDTFTLKRNLVIDICRRIIERRIEITWAAISRVDCVDAKMLFWMRRAGCTQISYGVESGSSKMREVYRKQISNEEIHRAFEITTRSGIMARAYFIYGGPGETDATIEDSLALLRRIRPLAAIFYILDLFPGTELYEAYKHRTGVTDDIWLERVEDILYFETDEGLAKEQVLAFGRRLREEFFSRLPNFAAGIELEDDPDFYPLHADFLSRLGLTFSHGEYAANPLIASRVETAITLFERSLTYHPDHRAFWGLGLVYQQLGRLDKSVEILQKGIDHHKNSLDLRLALANSLMRLKRYSGAKECLEAASDHPRSVELLIQCCRLMKDREGEQRWREQLMIQRVKNSD